MGKRLNQGFFSNWTPDMSYVLGYIAADGCITVSKERKNRPYSLNITSIDKKHLYKIRRALSSNHKISKKSGGGSCIAYQLQIRNPILTNGLINRGIIPRKTFRLAPIKVPRKYFSDFTRGFFDGDGSVYIYKVNGVFQIKADFISVSSPFIQELNKSICKSLNINLKTIHRQNPQKSGMAMYGIVFYVDDCEKLAEFFYGNNPNLYLTRKHSVFKKWKSIKRRHYLKKDYPSKVGWHLNHAVLV